MTASQRRDQRLMLERAMTPVAMRQALLDVAQFVYVAGSSLRYRDSDSTEPTRQATALTGTVLEGVRQTRVVTSARDRSVTIRSVHELHSDQQPDAAAHATESLTAGTALADGDMTARRELARKVLADARVSMRDETQARAEDGQPWLRSLVHRRVVSGDEQGERFVVAVETRLRRIDPSASKSKP